jgi:peptide/nickel transport system permease protein
MLILLLSLNLGWFPVGGFGEGFTGHLHSMFLPSLTVALFIAPILVRSLRVGLLDVLESDYVTTARSKGISESRVMTRHALRNAVISTVVILGINIGFLVGGTIVIEKVFALPGIGALMIDSIFNRDFAVVQGITLFYALLVILVYLVTDLLHATLDPRVQLS